ncbi:hypothetical protein VW23_000490 [Devosia insulae DS-56]|uniref:Uncharacterized protein n=1 Tax=Devosia insulae DS-56 TaxID=1116389 RepID=A0A1E5XHP3_9HYPH|nr:hypothetical protein [Devosia insulae]OEO28106.1 hypothetical protein VW23_000490 [Devosia insulae DS-56]
MTFDLNVAARKVRELAVRRFWTTPQQRWTTGFAIGGLVLASLVMPPFGVAVFGGAFAGWGLAVVLVAVFSGLVGNRIGIGREKAEIAKRAKSRE